LTVEKAPAKVSEQLATVSSAIERASELTHQLLTFSKPGQLKTEALDANELVARVAQTVRSRLSESIHIRTSPETGVWPVEGDVGQLEHVLVNLCNNAGDAIPQRPGNIEIRVCNTTHESLGDCVQLAVIDDGVGMSSEVLERIFEPFFTTKQFGHGAGLGLSIAFGVVSQHQGKIECHSEVGKGTQFSIYLPLTRQPKVSEGRPQQALTTGMPENLKILVVDDEPLIIKSFELLLPQLGHRVVSAKGGLEALARLATDSEFDLILLDLTMPGMTGLETLAEIRNLSRDIPVIVCSGYSDDAERVMNHEYLRVSAFLGKPFRMRDLNQLISSINFKTEQPGGPEMS